MIGSFVKWYRVPFETVLYDMTYANLMLYGAVIPSIDSGKDKDHKEIDASDPRNAQYVSDLIDNMI